MDQPEAPRNHDNTTEGIRHSGEALTNEFKAPLESVAPMQFDNVPQSPSTMLENMPPVITTDEAITTPIVTPETQTSVEAPKNKVSIRTKLAVLVAGLTLTGAAAAGVTAVATQGTDEVPTKTSDDNSQVEEGTGQPNTEPETPSVDIDPSTLTGEALTQYFEIPNTLTGEALAKAYVAKESEWNMFGTNPQLPAQILSDPTLGSTALIEQHFSDKGLVYSADIKKGLFTPEALEDPAIQNYVQNLAQTNGNSQLLYVSTSPEAQDPNDEVPYKMTVELESFTSSTLNPDGSETIIFTTESQINDEQNSALEHMSGSFVDGEIRQFVLTFTNDGKNKKVNSGSITTLGR